LKDELSETMQRTSDMVKEREDAISELLKENEEMKTRLDRDESENSAAHEELVHLREELEASARALEASQDRNVLLEEELESWISRGQETETELLTVQDEAEEWHRQADSSISALNVAEAKVKDATHRTDTLEATVKALRKKHLEQLEEQEKRHTEALLDQKEKITAKLAEAENSDIPMNPQDMMLQKAVADRKAKDASKAGWGSVIQQFRNGSNETDEAQSDDRKKIQELERDNADKDEELAKTKSEVVRMRSSYNDTLYMNKKRIEELENENEECFAKLRAMEAELGALRLARGDQHS
jgi:chromosome segregation ATPase